MSKGVSEVVGVFGFCNVEGVTIVEFISLSFSLTHSLTHSLSSATE